MVATTFAADTPLVVAGIVYSQGIAGNWIWWAFLLSGMMTVFLFARLWRRSGLMTDVQFAEMRYCGKAGGISARVSRDVSWAADELPDPGLGDEGDDEHCGNDLGADDGSVGRWLELGFADFLTSIFGADVLRNGWARAVICIFFLIPFTGIYVSLGGLWGVLWTDLFQFVLKMAIVIGVAITQWRRRAG